MTRKLTSTLLTLMVLINAWCISPAAMASSCPGFHTQTQGGWGAVPNGGNPGTYLHANFAAAFPSGLTVGCTDKLKLTSAQAVTNFLPSGSTPTALPPGTLVNPDSSTYQNVFAGQVVALTLSVGFDNYDPNFASSTNHLQDLVIGSGTFAGWTVSHLLDEANKKLGGCYSPYSFSQLNDAVDAVNNNYVDGSVSGSYLNCTPPPPPVITVNGVGSISCYGGNTGSVDISVSGGYAPYTYHWSNGATTQDLSNVAAGTYSVTVIDANGTSASTSVTVSQPSSAFAVSLTTTNPSCYNSVNGSITSSVSNGTAASYHWSNGATTANIYNLAAGTYSVTVTSTAGCSATASATLVSPAQIVAYTNCVQVCYGMCNGSATVYVVSGGTAPYTYHWQNGSTASTISNLCAGVYWVTITDAHSCTKILSATVNSNPQILLSGTSSNVSCNGACNGSVSLTISGGMTPYHFNWNDGNTAQDRSSLCAGTYSVTATDIVGCTATASFTVGQPNVLAIVPSHNNVLCHGGNSGSASVSVSGGTSPYSYMWNTGATTSSISNLAAGTYTVTVTDAHQCSATASIVVSQPDALSIIASGVNDSNCLNPACDGSASVTINGGTAPFVIHWSNSASTANISGLCPDADYGVTVTDANGCSTSGSVHIGCQPPPPCQTPVINITGNTAPCTSPNATVTLGVGGLNGFNALSYAWSNNATTSSISVSASGNYCVTVEVDQQFCLATACAQVAYQPLPVVTPSHVDATCNGACNGSASLSVSAVGSYTVAWSNGMSGANISGLCTGSYGYTVTSDAGCAVSGSIAIGQPNALQLSVSHTNVTCYNAHNGSATASASGGAAPYAYLWSNGKTTATINSLAPGTYSVTATDANGCSATGSTVITQPSAIVAYANCIHTCPGTCNSVATITVSGGTAPYTFHWADGSTDSVHTGLCVGVYWLTITDAHGCTKILAATVTAFDDIVISGSSSNVTCNGACNGSITETVSGGNSTSFTYLWNDNATTLNRTNLCAGTYSVTVTSQYGCTATASYVITQPQALTVALTPFSPLCFGGGDGSVSTSVNGGTAPYTYAWSNGATTANISGIASGNYSVTVTDAHQCTATGNATVNVPTQIVATASHSNVNCYGEANGSASVSATGGTQPYTYHWSNNATTSAIENLTAGTYNVTVYDAHQCSATASVVVSQPSLLTASASGTDVTCFGTCNGSANVAINGGTQPYNVSWSNNANGGELTGLCAGTYTFTVTDAHNCSATGSVTIHQPQELDANVTAVDVLCFGDSTGSISVTAMGGTAAYEIVWTDGSMDFNRDGLAAGQYCFTITDFNGCAFNGCATIGQPSQLLAYSVCSMEVSCPGTCDATIDVTAFGGTPPYTFVWNDGATTEDRDSLCPGTYSVTITDQHGCTFELTHAPIMSPEPLHANISGTDDSNCLNPICDGTASVAPVGGTVPYTIHWSTNDTTASINSLCPDHTYYVTVADANGCSVVDSIHIGCQPPPPCQTPVITISGNLAPCTSPNASITLGVDGLGNFTALSYTWSDSSHNATLAVSASGTYCVTVVVDQQFCLATACATVAYQPLPVVSEAFTNATCHGSCNGSATLTVSAVGSYSVSWSNGMSTASISGLCAGTYGYTVTSNAGCAVSGSILIGQPAALSVAVESNNVICNDSYSGSISLIVSGGTPSYTVAWNDGSEGTELDSLHAGTYTYTVTDANGCFVIDSVIITEPEPLLASSVCPEMIMCHNACTGAIDVTVYGGVAPYTFLWNDGATTEDRTNLCPGTYTVTITDHNGCTFVLTHAPFVNPEQLVITANPSDVSCYGTCDGAASVSISGGLAPYNVSWSNNAIGGEVSGLCAGTYYFTATDANGCTASDSVVIGQPQPLQASSVVNQITCSGSCNASIDVTVSGGTEPYVYHWSNNATTQDLSGLCAGTYSLTVTDGNNCSTVLLNILINNVAPISVSVDAQNVTCYNEWNGSINLTISGGTAPYTVDWNNNYSGSYISELNAGTYCYTVTDAHGCTASDCITITEPLPLLASSYCPTMIECYGSCTGSIDVTVYGGQPPYTFAWSSTNGFTSTDQNISGLCAGTYTLTVTDANGCTYELTHQPFENPDAVTATIATINDTNCGDNICNGQAAVTVTGGMMPYSFAWSTNSNDSAIVGLCPGQTVSVTVTDIMGCVASASVPSIGCDTVPPPACAPLYTVTQGGWGAVPHGGNPAVYLYANFAAAFPNGLTVGCTGGHTLKLTTPQAITAFLPSGSTASVLTTNLVNPGSAYTNVLAGQLVAATLNVTFDAYDSAFASSSNNLGNYFYTSGTFAGMTVNQVLAIANDVLGGCSSAYTPSQVNDALSNLNENYDEGTADQGHLSCTPPAVRMSETNAPAASALTANVYPNPNSGQFNVAVNAVADGKVTVKVVDMLGRVVMSNAYNVVSGGNVLDLNFSNTLSSASYTLMITDGSNTVNKMIIVRK